MIKMVRTIYQKIERYLFQRHFSIPAIRQLLATQILISLIFIFFSMLSFWFTLYPTAFAIGAVIATTNFWQIAKFSMKYVGASSGSRIPLLYFFFFILRFTLTGVVLFLTVIMLKIPVIPLLFGLIVSVATVVLWATSKFYKKPAKEV